MYRKTPDNQLAFEDFYLPFGGKLRSDNRWVLLASMVPWELAETFYAQQFSKSGPGAPPKSARIALGALIIKERLGVSDEEAVEQICENPYLQYFLGFHEYQDKAPFDPSMFVYFRKRFDLEQLNQINETLVLAEQTESQQEEESYPPEDDDSDDDNSSGDNRGKLIVDATCTPADIRYPTDISLVNEAREKSEQIIDILFEPLKGYKRKPRTYRQKARRQFLACSKSRKRSARQTRKALGQQLGFLRRNLNTIGQLAGQTPLTRLDRRQYKNLLVIHELYRQQQWMYENRCHRISGRIVSISQPHIRPIIRGKASAPTEFGAKLSASLVDGSVFLDRLDWDPFNESGDLIGQIETYKQRFGCNPESVHCDAIYRTQANRKYCKEWGIRMSGPPLGRPPKKTPENAAELKSRKKQQYQDEIDRIPIEGKFGQSKRRFSLNRVMTKLSVTSETAIAITFIVMNMEKWLQKLLFALLWHLFQPSIQLVRHLHVRLGRYVAMIFLSGCHKQTQRTAI
jgi:hypothetical protein